MLSASSVNFSTHHFPGPEKDKEGGCIDMDRALHSLTAMELCPLLIFKSFVLMGGKYGSSGCHYFLYHLVREELKLCQ